MSVSDDELTQMFADARDRIDVPAGGPASILAAERAARPTVSRPRASVPVWRRLPVVAAAAASLAVGVVGAVTWEASPVTTAARTNSLAPSSGGFGIYGDGNTLLAGGSFATADGDNALSTGSVPSALSARIEASGNESISVARGDVASALSALAHLVQRDHGFVATTKYVAGRAGGATATGTVTLQVPVASFAALVSAVQSVGHVTAVTTSSNDVTGQYVDLQAQIAALRASRTQYLAILQKATTIPDILRVQSQITSIQGQIQALEGQLYLLTNETTYGALVVTVSVVGAPVGVRHAPESGIRLAVHDSIGGFVTAFEGLVRVVGPALFGALCLASLYLVGRSGRRAWRRRMI